MNKLVNSGSNYCSRYDKLDFDKLFNSISLEKDLTKLANSSLFVSEHIVSQSKLRDCGFKIKREISKADYVLIRNPYTLVTESQGYNTKKKEYYDYSCKTTKIVDLVEACPDYKYVYINDLYKLLYKYDGNIELFTACSELLESNSPANVKIAMEYMVNANWDKNQIYLVELFNLYWSNISRSTYKTSISYKGFLESLDFGYGNMYLNDANDYREYCITEEHHNFVYDKFKSKFETELAELMKTYKIKLEKIKYTIDKNIYTDEN